MTNLDRILTEALDLEKRILYINLMKLPQVLEISPPLIFGVRKLLRVGLSVRDHERRKCKAQVLGQENIVQKLQAYLVLLNSEGSMLAALR